MGPDGEAETQTESCLDKPNFGVGVLLPARRRVTATRRTLMYTALETLPRTRVLWVSKNHFMAFFFFFLAIHCIVEENGGRI